MLYSVEWEDKFIIIEAEKEELCRQIVTRIFGRDKNYAIWKATEWDKWYFTEYWNKSYFSSNENNKQNR